MHVIRRWLPGLVPGLEPHLQCLLVQVQHVHVHSISPFLKRVILWPRISGTHLESTASNTNLVTSLKNYPRKMFCLGSY